MTQTDLTAADEPQAPPVTQGPQGPEGPEVPEADRQYQDLLEKARTGDVEARGQLRRRLMDPLTDPGTKRDISAALEAGVTEEAEAIKEQPVRAYRPAWFGMPESQVSLGRLRNAEMLGRTKLSPEFLERQAAGSAGIIETGAETFFLPPLRMLSIALGATDVDVEERTKELGSEIEFLEQTIIPKAVDALKAGHNTQEIINGLKAQGIEADREFGKSVDAAFKAEGIDTKGGYTRLFSSPGELFIQRVKQLPEEELSWAMIKDKGAKAFPLVGTLLESADQARQEEAINRVAEGKGTEEDNLLLEAMLIDQYRARSTEYKAVEGIIDMAGFGADLWTGGQIAKLGGKAAALLPGAAKAVGAAKFQKALANVAAWSNKTPTSLLQRATRSATRATMEAGRVARQTVAQVAGEAAGSAALTGIAGALDRGPDEAVFGRAELETKRQQIFQAISGGIDPQSGKFFMAADTVPPDAPEVTLPNAVGLLVDVAVEKLGRFVNVPGINQTPAARRRMLDSLARAVDPAKADRLSYAISQGANALEINGIVGEILEEYASRTGMAAIGEITGDPEYGRLGDIIPAGEAIADEFIAIASGAGLLQGAGAASAAIGAAGQTQRDRERLTRRIEYMRDVEAAATDPAAAERVRQTNEATRRATGEEVDAALSRVGGTRAEQPEGLEAEQAAQRAADLGIELVFFEGPAEQTGFYDPSSPSTIYINTKAEDPGGALEIETTVHEIAHDMEAVVGEEAFGALTGKLRDADPERWDEAKEDARDELGEVFGEGVLRPIGAAAESEAAASRAEDNGVLVDLLLRSQNARQDIQRILQTDQNLFQKVRDGVRNLLSIIPGVKTAKAKGLENLRGALEKRGLEGAELERALEDAELTTADEVSAAMIDVAEMRQLARLRQTRAYIEGVAVTEEELYLPEQEFEDILAEPVEAEAEVAAAPAAPTRTLAQVEAEIAEIQRMGKKSTLGDRRRKKLLQEEAEALRAQEAAGLIPVGEPRALPLSPMAQAAAERARGEMEAERAAAALPVMPQAARAEAEQPTAEPFLPGARVRINEDAAAFDDIIRQAQDIRGLEVVDATGPAGAQRVEVKVPGEMGTLIVPASDLTLAQPAPGQPSVGGLPYAAMPTIGEREAQERTREDIEQGRTRFARRRRRRRKPREVVINQFNEEPPTWRERVRISLFDRLARLEKFEKDAFKQGLRLSQAESPTMAARLMPGKTTYKQEQLELNYVNPILNVLAKAGISLPDFEDFLILRTTEESNEDLRRKRAKAENNRVVARKLEAKWKNTRIDPELPDDVKKEKKKERKDDRKEAKRLRREADFIDPGKDPKSYYTDEEAQAKLAEIEKDPERKKQLEEAGRLVDEMNTQTRKRLLDYGLITQKQFDDWTNQFKHYVPFRTDEGNSSWAEMNTAGYSVSGPEARIRRGTTRKPNPLLFSVQQAGRAIVRGEKNQVGVRAYKFFEKANMLVDVQDLEPGQEVPDLSGSPRFSLKIDGEQKVITLKDEYLAKALKKFGPNKTGDPTFVDQFIERAGKLTRFMADANTQYNPEFVWVNSIRDQIDAQLKVGELRERGFELSRTGLYLDTRRARKALRRKGGIADERMAEYYRRFGEAGGLIRLGDMQDYQESVEALEKKLDRLVAASSTNPVGKGFNWIMDLVSRQNRAAELATRLAVFKQLVDNGATDAQAAAVARDITVDFNRRGQDTAAINSLYMFFNATMQGTDRNMRALKSKAGRRTAAALFAAGYMHSYVQAMMSDEDEDGRLEWDNEKWYNKARNLAVGIGTGKILKLPLPYFWSVFFFGGQLFDSLTRGAMNAEQAGALLLASTLNDLQPFQFGADPDNLVNAGLLAQILPDAVRAPVELAVNRDYRGETILTPRFPGETRPARERGRGQDEDFVSGLSQKAVDAIAAITGQTPLSTGGLFDWNPDAVEYLLGSYFGSTGGFIMRGAKMAEAGFSEKKDVQLEGAPFLRKFIGRAALGGVRNNYFDGRERIQKVESRFKAMLKAGDKESAKWIAEQDPTALRFATGLRKMEKRRKVLYDARNAAKTAEEREAIEARIDAELGAFVEAFDTAEAQVKD